MADMSSPPLPRPPAAMTAPAISAALTDTTVQVKSDFRGARIVLYGPVFDASAKPSGGQARWARAASRSRRLKTPKISSRSKSSPAT